MKKDNKNNTQFTATKQVKKAEKVSKMSRFFAVLYFVVTIISLLIYTATSSVKIVKNGWNTASITLVIFLALNYLVLLACIIFAKNSKSAKANYTKAKKGLKVGKKLMKIINAISTVIIIVSVKSTDLYDIMSKITAFVSLFMHVLGLAMSIATIFVKRAIKKKIGKQKQLFKEKFGKTPIESNDKENNNLDKSSQPIEIDDGQVELSFPTEQSESAAAIDNSAALSAKLADKLNLVKNKAKDLFDKNK